MRAFTACILFAALVAAIPACRTAQPAETLVLPYQAFGPQAASHQLIGNEWWQWHQHGDSDPSTKYDVKVVVYRGASEEEAARRYPVDQDKQQDYRYLAHVDAIAYLDRMIKENALPELTASLQETRQRIIAALGAGDPQ